MTPELASARRHLADILHLLNAHEAQESPRVPVPLAVADLPTYEECDLKEPRNYGLPCIYVHATAGPLLVFAIRWWDKAEGWYANARHAYPDSDAVYAITDVTLYPLSDWPALVRGWLASRGTP